MGEVFSEICAKKFRSLSFNVNFELSLSSLRSSYRPLLVRKVTGILSSKKVLVSHGKIFLHLGASVRFYMECEVNNFVDADLNKR